MYIFDIQADIQDALYIEMYNKTMYIIDIHADIQDACISNNVYLRYTS